ncbi:hypothetical protein [Streptomyces chryseus]
MSLADNLRSFLANNELLNERAEELLAAHRDQVRTEFANRVAVAIEKSYASMPDLAVQRARRMGMRAAERVLRPDAPTEPQVVYRAALNEIPLGLYATQSAARAHCLDAAKVHAPDDVEVTYDWIGDESEPADPWELVVEFGGQEQPTGFTVTELTVASEYDPEATE